MSLNTTSEQIQTRKVLTHPFLRTYSWEIFSSGNRGRVILQLWVNLFSEHFGWKRLRSRCEKTHNILLCTCLSANLTKQKGFFLPFCDARWLERNYTCCTFFTRRVLWKSKNVEGKVTHHCLRVTIQNSRTWNEELAQIIMNPQRLLFYFVHSVLYTTHVEKIFQVSPCCNNMKSIVTCK